MKIYILPVDKRLQPPPPRKPAPWLSHSVGFIIETDFLDFLHKHKELLTDNPDEADWHYLPVFWCFWFLSHSYGRVGRDELIELVKSAILDDKKTFTICEFDYEPKKDIVGKTKLFCVGWGRKDITIVPILCKPNKFPSPLPLKKYLASFNGKFKTHPMRSRMALLLMERKEVNVFNERRGMEVFVHSILESYATLCPRGSADCSFRFFQSMQLGVVPIMIGDSDTRPFKDYINWDAFSYYLKDINRLPALLDTLDKEDLLKKGKLAKEIWYGQLWNQGWCQFVLNILEK